MPRWQNLQPLPWGLWEGCLPQKHNFRTYQYLWTKLLLKLWIGWFWGKYGRGRGFVALKSFLTIKKGTSPFNFQSNELFLKFLWQQMAISTFPSDTFWEDTRRGSGVYTPWSLWILKRAQEHLVSNHYSRVFTITLSTYILFAPGYNL